ncbi:hypothetical protein [Radiobacillus sp. PE A8.2]
MADPARAAVAKQLLEKMNPLNDFGGNEDEADAPEMMRAMMKYMPLLKKC